MSACMPHVVPRVLKNDAHLFLLDVEIHAHKFTFPPPGKTSGEVHDRLCQQNAGKPVVTIGFGPDFAVLRSRGVLMNIPRMVGNSGSRSRVAESAVADTLWWAV